METIVGRNPVLMSLRLQRRTIHEMLVVHGMRDPRIRDAIRIAKTRGIPYRYCSHEELNRLAPGIRHQGIALRASALPALGIEDLIGLNGEGTPLLVALDQVQDPHNLGAVIRTADATGASGVIIPKKYAAGNTATIARTSAGSIEAVPLVEVTNLVHTLGLLKERGFWVVGADLSVETDYWSIDAQRPLCLVLGSEGEGLRRLVRKACDELVRIPITGAAESLNVSVAAGVMLYEVLRQRNAG